MIIMRFIFSQGLFVIHLSRLNHVVLKKCMYVQLLSSWLVSPCLDFVSKGCKHMVHCQSMHLTRSLLNLYECMLDEVRYMIRSVNVDCYTITMIHLFSMIQMHHVALCQ